jgi:hypothetical protein
MRVVPPDLNSTRARIADWLELQALTSDRQAASLSAVRSLVRRMSDGRASVREIDPESDDVGEPEITERLADDLEERASEELEFRAKLIGPAYPLELVTEPGGRAQSLRLRTTWSEHQTGQLIYVFCLLDSGIRDGLIDYPVSARPLVRQIGNLFQICSCLAVGGYTGAEVVSFGFPRATGDGFLPALHAAWQRYGSYRVRHAISHGFDDSLKDGGVDIIAWRHFPDRHAGTFLMFVQVASGHNWKGKAVLEDVLALRTWFEGPTFTHFVPAICIPFPLWFDLDEPAEDDAGTKVAFADGVRVRFTIREAKFGVIFDRGRIARAAADALAAASASSPSTIDGIERIEEVRAWVQSVMTNLADARVT